MARKPQAAKLKEPVKLRKRERKDGTLSLYLDIYQKGVRKNEFLNLYLIPEKTTEDRQRNRQTLAVAERVKSQRIIALQDHGLDNWNTIKRSVMPIFNLLANTYYLDWINENILARGARALGTGLWKGGDQAIIDGALVNGSWKLVGLVSGAVRKAQTGFLYHYALVMILGIFVLMTYFVWLK